MRLEAIHGLRARQGSAAGLENRTNSKPVLSEPGAVIRFVCAVCGTSISPGSRGKPKRFCGDACRKRERRGATAVPAEATEPSGNTRDVAISNLCYAIKSADGLRGGIDTLARIIEGEKARIAAMPDYTRRQLAQRLAGTFGFTLKEEHVP